LADIQKTKPFSVEAEQSVLGSVLIDPECITGLIEIISASDFYIPEHGEIFDAMCELFNKNRNIDIVTLINMLTERGVYSAEECKKYVGVIADVVPSAANVKDYARIVHDKAVLRALIDASEEITENAYSARGEVKYILDDAEQKIFNLSRTSDTKGFVSIREALVDAFNQLDKVRKDPDAAAGIKTGYEDLDRCIVGLTPGDMVIIGARPGMGKTSFAMNIATNVAKSTKKTVCVFSLEMTTAQLASRILASEALVDSYSMRSGKISGSDYDHLAKAAAELSSCDIQIDDTAAITVTQIKAKLRRMKNLGLVIIDYLQLMQGDKKAENRVNEVGEVSRGLKLLAKDLAVPVICCAQLSRPPKTNENARPGLSDLRESGQIEQDADIVMFLHGDYSKADAQSSEATLIIAKNRHGSAGDVRLGWIGKYTKFVTAAAREDTDGN
jgi:replicative DNA helicase